MSALTDEVLEDHTMVTVTMCGCGDIHDGYPRWRARHIAEATEKAVRKEHADTNVKICRKCFLLKPCDCEE